MELFYQFGKHGIHKVEAWRQALSRKFLLQQDLFFCEGIVHEDVLFYFQVLQRAERVIDINQKLYVYRKREGSITHRATINRAQSLFIVCMRILKDWKYEKYSKEVNHAVHEYLKNFFGDYVSIQNQFPGIVCLENGSYRETELYCMLQSHTNKYKNIELLPETCRRIEASDGIYIYGAGKIAGEVLELLEDYGKKPRGYIVSDITKNPSETINGINILQFDNPIINKEALILIGVGSSKTGDIIELLKRENYCNYISMAKSKWSFSYEN
jgi:hypothetical protein